MTRHLALLLPLVVCLSGCNQNQLAREPSAQEQAAREEKAVKAIEAMGGRVFRDEKLPSHPVVDVVLIGNQFTDATLKYVTELKGLHRLNLSVTKITDAGLNELKELKGLQELHLGHTQITDAGLKDLKGLKDLQMLGLDSTQITDTGIKDLKAMKSLQMLYLRNTKITAAGLKELQEALPDTKIIGP